MDTFWTIIVAVIGSSGVSALIQFLITRHDEKKGKRVYAKCLEANDFLV